MTRRRFVTSLFVAVAVVEGMAVVPAAHACRCLEPTSAASAYKAADVVALGKVVSVTPQREAERTEITLHVTEAWKADLPRSIQIVTGTPCAFPFARDGRYLLFLLRGSENRFVTERCMGNRDLAHAHAFRAWLEKHGKVGKVRAETEDCTSR